MDIVIIAHFVTEFDKDGTSRFVYLGNRLNKFHDVEIITSKFDHISKRQRLSFQYKLGFKLTFLDEPSYKKNVSLKRFLSHYCFGKEVKKYLELRNKPDVIYCAVPSLDCAYYAAKYAKQNNIKLIIDIQDLWPEAFKMILKIPIISDMIFYPLTKRANYIYSSADKIVGVSKTYCDRAIQANRKNTECLSVFLGTKLQRFDKFALENRIQRSDNKFILGYCGTLGHSYDIKCVLDAMIYLRSIGYSNIEFWIMGDGPLKEHFENYAMKNDLNVVFYGRVPYPKMCGLISSCDVCMNPISKDAAQSIINKHADYAASGLPVISTQESPEYRHLIDAKMCGINCKCGDRYDMAQAIIKLMTDTAMRKSMGRNARRMAEELFDRDKSYSSIINLFMGDN